WLVPYFPCGKPFVSAGVVQPELPQGLLLDGVIDVERIIGIAGNADVSTAVAVHVGDNRSFRIGMRLTNGGPEFGRSRGAIDDGEFLGIAVHHFRVTVIVKIVYAHGQYTRTRVVDDARRGPERH